MGFFLSSWLPLMSDKEKLKRKYYIRKRVTIMNNPKKEAVTQSERQLNQNQKIINDIITILVNNNLSISNAKEILRITMKKLDEQKITISF